MGSIPAIVHENLSFNVSEQSKPASALPRGPFKVTIVRDAKLFSVATGPDQAWQQTPRLHFVLLSRKSLSVRGHRPQDGELRRFLFLISRFLRLSKH